MTLLKKRWFLAFLPILSGLLLALTVPSFDAGFLVWFALVPLLWYIHHATTMRRVFWGGLATGTIYVIKVLYPLGTLDAWWWASGTNTFFASRAYILGAILFFVALYSGGMFVGLFSILYKKYGTGKIGDMFIFAFIWTIFELLREPLVFGFTWGHLGYALHSSTIIAQLASVGLVYSLSFLIVAINIGIFQILFFNTTARNRALYCVILLVVGTLLFGSTKLSNKKSGQTVRVAAIHMDITTEESRGVDAYNAYLSLIDQALALHPTLIVLPENAFPFFVIDHKTHLPMKYQDTGSSIGKLFDSLTKRSTDNKNVSFVIGMHSVNKNKIHNSIIVLENGSITGMYDKRRLMPLAEDDTKILRSELTKPFSQGDQEQTLTAQGVRITPLICSEIIFPSLSREKTSDIIINASNDSVFRSKLVGEQNHIIAQIRAIENRKPLIRSVKGGVSSIIDARGSVLAQARGKRTVIHADISY